MNISRREFFRRSGCGIGSAAALAAGIERFGLVNAMAQGSGYKALVCVFLAGGNDGNNMVVMTGQLINLKVVVNYTIDASGQVHNVWILRPEEVKMRPWPVTTAQAQAWAFDPAAQTWTKP